MRSTLIIKMDENYKEYLIDESKYEGSAESISFPENEEEMIQVVATMKEAQIPITIQGGKTAITGSAIPKEGHIMNLSRMNHCIDFYVGEDGNVLLRVEPGMSLMQLKIEVARIKGETPLIWPPDPTETSATIGGIVATNAKGPNQYLYGDTKQYIYGVKMLTAEGEIETYSRKKDEKQLDVILGKEGITGAFSELTLRLVPKPESIWCIAFFFEADGDVGAFIKEMENTFSASENAWIVAVEYLDRNTIDLIEQQKNFMAERKDLPDVEPRFEHMIYVELQGVEDAIVELAGEFMELAEKHNSDPDKAWAISNETQVDRIKAFRHAAAETVNLHIQEMRRQEKRLTKLGTDMSLQGENFDSVLLKAKADIKKQDLNYCIFGHVLDNHLHINLLPKDFKEYQKGICLIEDWARNYSTKGGAIVTEHGIGKLKKELFLKYGDKKYLNECKAVKSRYDPNGFWNPGNIYD
ncbi:FAD-binding oxidoreductase [Lachnospiraceae bacterium ZAX-1]